MDNVAITEGSGAKNIRTDDVGGVQYQVIKLALGADGVDNGFVSAGTPMPISLASTTITGTAAVTQSGTWASRTQDGVGNAIASSTSSPAGTEQGLIVRNIPSGTQTVTGTVAVSGSAAVTGPLTDTQLRATAVPVSGTVTASGPLTDTQLRATAVPISGTVTANAGSGTMAVSGPLTDTQLRATAVPISGTVTASGPLTDTQLRATAVPVSLASTTLTGTSAVNQSQINGVALLTGNGITGTGSQRVTIASDNTAFSVNAIQSGTWNITNLSGTVSLPTGAATSANQTTLGSQTTKINDGTTTAEVVPLTNYNALATAIVDGSGNQITSFGGGTQYTEDAASAADPVGTVPILVRKDAPGAIVTTDGDNIAQRGTNYGAAYVQVVSSSGSFIDSFGGSGGTAQADRSTFTDGATNATPVAGVYNETNTNPTEDQAAAVRITQKRAMHVNLRDASGNEVSVGGGTQYNDGAARGSATGTLALGDDGTNLQSVKCDASGVLAIQDNGGSLTVDGTFWQATQPVSGTVTANAGTGTFTVTGPLTDTQLRATAVPVSGTITANAGTGTFAVSGPLTDTQLRATAVPVSLTSTTITGTVAATQSGTWNINNVSGTVSLPTGAATAAKQPTLGTAGTPSSDVLSVQGIASMTALKVDGSAVTQPVSGTVTATGPLTDTQLRATAVPISGTITANAGSGTMAVSGPLTDTQLRATAVPVSLTSTTITGTVAATQSGTWNVTNVSGTVSLPTGASTSANQSTIITSLQLLDDAVVADNAGFTDGTTKLNISGYIYDEVAGTALSENDAAAARINVNRAVVSTVEDGVTRGRYATVTAANALKVDGSAVTQPISGTVTANAGTGTMTVTGVLTDTQLRASAVPVSLASVPSHAVTNAGTFAVQATNANLDLAQAAAIGSKTGPMIQGSCTTAAPTYTTGTVNPLSLDTAGNLRVTGGGGGTQYIEDDVAAANPTGTVPILIRKDTPATQVTTDGDNVAQRGTNYGAAYVQVVTSAGSYVDTFGGGTQYTEDAVAAADPIGTASILVRADTPAALVTTDGDNVAHRGTNYGAAYGTLIADNGTLVHPAQGAAIANIRGNLAQGSCTTSAPTYTTATINPLSLTTSGSLRVADIASLAQGSTTSGQSGTLMQAAVTTSSPTYTTAQTSPLSLDTAGRLRVVGTHDAGIYYCKSTTARSSIAAYAVQCLVNSGGTGTLNITFTGNSGDATTAVLLKEGATLYGNITAVTPSSASNEYIIYLKS